MPPRCRARRDGVGNCGDRGCGLGVPLKDEVSQHRENPNKNPELGARQNTEIPNAHNFARGFVTALMASNLLPQAPRDNTTSRAMEAMREFRRAGPPKFDGEGDDFLKANYWLVEIRKAFNALKSMDAATRIFRNYLKAY